MTFRIARLGTCGVGLLMLAACAAGPSGHPTAAPVVETRTPYPDMVTITLPPGVPQARAGSLARMSCPIQTFPLLHAVSDRSLIYRCIDQT